MYKVAIFDEANPQVLRDLISTHPLSTLITLNGDGLNANQIPLIWQDDGSEFGALHGHIARANPLWQDFSSEVDTLAVFQGASAYISPSWYATKAETGKVVPTYNYATVQAYGELIVHDDSTWLLAQLNQLTNKQEVGVNSSWTVNDAPADYIAQMMKVIVGIEIKIKRMAGKWKVSQNQPVQNQLGVINGLKAKGDDDMVAYMQAKLKEPS